MLLFQGLQDNNGLNSGAVSHFEPQVAMLCDAGPHGQEAYHSKYMSEQGEWVSDFYSKATCFKDKMDILNYCKKVTFSCHHNLLTIDGKKGSYPFFLYKNGCYFNKCVHFVKDSTRNRRLIKSTIFTRQGTTTIKKPIL